MTFSLIKFYSADVQCALKDVFQLTRDFLFSKKQCEENKIIDEQNEDQTGKWSKGTLESIQDTLKTSVVTSGATQSSHTKESLSKGSQVKIQLL